MNSSYKRPYKYYSLLEVQKGATLEEIKNSYRKLAKKYHPDINPSPEALEIFKKINLAYEVLGNPNTRASYDASPYECPSCWTHEVIFTGLTFYRCRKCGCKFSIDQPAKIIEVVIPEAIPERWEQAIKLFQTAQCSWCAKFYTNEPFLCPYNTLKSSCSSFKKINESERRQKLADSKWWWRIYDSVIEANKLRHMHMCRYCLSINPYPQKTTCWNCGKPGLNCTSCGAAPVLVYDIYTKIWKCSNSACGRKFAYVARSKDPKPQEPNQAINDAGGGIKKHCPRCRHELTYSPDSLVWKCSNKSCRSVYTERELKRINTKNKTAPKWMVPTLVFVVLLAFFFVLYGLGVFAPYI
ncbi:MAG: DnaJ domain-containing protein [Dehalococcoidales bacterium]|jgi:ribosomal protein L37AE/L43A|nr:DnaJ domain-containing protein [Dehalococcoidales bacterium]MDD5499088.1 DnaJ domain-containing protein [Dehalococcoidales bacterium]